MINLETLFRLWAQKLLLFIKAFVYEGAANHNSAGLKDWWDDPTGGKWPQEENLQWS